MALTDATFLLLFLLALGLGMRFLQRPGVLRAVLFGLAVGLAQLTKYNGFLAGVSVALVAVLGLFERDPERRRRAVRALGFGLLAATTAALCYWPWFQFVQTYVPGGYAGLVRHHRGYLTPAAQWPRNALVQWAEAITLSGSLVGWFGWGAIGWVLAWFGAGLWSGRFSAIVGSTGRAALRARLALPLGALILGAFPDAPWWLTLVSLPWLWRLGNPGARVLAAAWVVQSLLLPMYHPYARLGLPLGVLGNLVTAGWLACEWNRGWEGGSDSGSRQRLPAWAGLATALVLAIGLRLGVAWPTPAAGLLAPTDGLRWLTGLAREASESHSRLFLLGRPSLLYYLTANHPSDVARLADETELLPLARRVLSTDHLPNPTRPRLVVDGTAAPEVSFLRDLGAFRVHRWAPEGNLTTWLDLFPNQGLHRGRTQAIAEPDAAGPEWGRDGQPHPELVLESY